VTDSAQAVSSVAGTGSIAGLISRIKLIAFDFDGVFTDNTVYVDQNGTEVVRCWRGDGIGLRKLDKLGIQSAIISTETNPVVTMRSRKLRIACYQGIENKRAHLESLLSVAGLTLSQVAFVGNDENDLSCLQCVALPIVVQDAHEAVLPYAVYRTKAMGGMGAVREICDLFEKYASTRGE